MKVSLRDGGWKGPWHDQARSIFVHTLLLAVEDAGVDTLELRIDDDTLSRLRLRDGRYGPKDFTEAFVRLALSRIAVYGPDGLHRLLGANMRHATYVINVEESDRAELLKNEKECRYQSARTGGDLFCSAAIRTSQTLDGATTKFACARCTLPDSRLACSHLHHAKVLVVPDEGQAQVREARCDAGRPEVLTEPCKCRPGGHNCWMRIVEFPARAAPVVSSLALHEAFDYFDAVWKAVFKAHILHMKAATVIGKLATPCASQSEFETKLSALSDFINSFVVADEDLSPEHVGSADYGKGRSLARIDSAIVRKMKEAGADASAIDRVKPAIGVLRSAMDLRRGYQHTGDASGKLPLAFSQFGLTYPPASAELAWGRVQEGVLDALATLRELLRELD